MRKIETLALAASLSVAGAFGANAATLDFTDLETFTGANSLYATTTGASGKLGAFAATTIWTLTPTPKKGPMRYNFSSDDTSEEVLIGTDAGYDGVNKPATSLKLTGDGVGIGTFSKGDEVDNYESLLLTFSRAVKITRLYFLDLFDGPQGIETALVSGDINASKDGTRNVNANTIGGYEYLDVDSGFTVLSLKFNVWGTELNGKCVGDDGTCDYALAGVEYELAPVPVPAAGLMLLSALGGVAALRRRKQA